ncbi:MAG: tetratricopeptide repeat protein [Leptolyngbya sp. SIO1E4]|nr:tetratricopeptide repeat protein [Leptolyngbya sp. SIO1E4]
MPVKPSDTPLGGRYQIIQQLGKGGFGQTFLAQDFHLPGHPICVIKQFKPQVSDEASLKTAQRLFDTEAKVLYALGNHDQIPRLMAHFEEDQEFYLAQEYIDGEPLNQVLANGEPWSQGRVIAFLQDMFQVLAFVHEQNVIHRDIKPSNLLCRRHDGRIVLIDFGAVKQVNTQFFNPQTGRTNLTISIGTQGYMPNEQLGGTPHFSSDVYAVGVIGIQALTGVQPKHLGQDPHTSELDWRTDAPMVDEAFAEVLDRMVCYDFRARYPTAAKALAALQELPSELQAKIPERWYLPGTAPLSPPDIPFPTQEFDGAYDSTLAVENSASAQSGQTLTKPYHLSEATLAAGGRSPTREFSTSQKPKGSTLAVASVLQGLPERRRWLLAGLIGLGALLFMVKSFSFLHPETPVVAIPSSAEAPSPSEEEAPSPAEAADPAETADPADAAPPAEASPTATDLLKQAEELRKGNQHQQALDIYDQAIAHHPESATAHWGRCYSLNQLQQAELALAACDQAIALDGNDPRPFSSKGVALQQQQRHGEALTLFDQAIDLQPDLAEAWNNRGTALMQLKRPEEALNSFDRAIEIQADLAEAWSNRGAALWNLRRFDEAIASIDQAIALNPNYADAQSLRQQIRNKLGR